MAFLLKALLRFLRILRSAKVHIKLFPRYWASFLAYLGRKLTRKEWPCSWPRCNQAGTFRSPTLAGPLFPGGGTSYSMSGGSACLGGYAVAASTVPASSASQPLGFGPEGQPPSAPSSPTGSPARLSVDQSRPASSNPTNQLDGRSFANRSSGNLSTHSRASDTGRLSITTNSRESLRASVRYSPASQPPRAIHRQFGRGSNPSRSREQLSRGPSPVNLPDITHSSTTPRLEIVAMMGPTHAHADGESSPPISAQSPAGATSSPSDTHQPLSPPVDREGRMGPTTGIVLDMHNRPTESLPIISPADRLETISLYPVMGASSTTSDFFMPDGRFLQMIYSEQIPRYTKNIKIPREEKQLSLKPLTTIFPYFQESNSFHPGHRRDCSPWIPATHPDGALYFYDPERRLFTDTDMHDQTLKGEMEDFYSYLQKIVRVNGLVIPSQNYDLVLDIMPTRDDTIQWSYYYACHETRCLFWLEEYDTTYLSSITYDLHGVESPAHLKHRMESLYWHHWSLFPVVFDDRTVHPTVYDELLGTLGYGCVDVMISNLSTFPCDYQTIQNMINVTRTAKETDARSECFVAGATRLLSFFAKWRFLYFHGQQHARLLKDQAVYDEPIRERTLLITLLSPFLLLGPEVYMRQMERLWVDTITLSTEWRAFVRTSLDEWKDLILTSTVMLSANVGFLAVPGVILSNLNGNGVTSANQVAIFTSPAQIASCLSIVTSVGGLVVALLLIREYRLKQDEDASSAFTELSTVSYGIFGTEPMAIVFSLPWALLLWSMIIFFVALLFESIYISNFWTRVSVLVTSIVVAVLIVWRILISRQSAAYWDVWRKAMVGLWHVCRG